MKKNLSIILFLVILLPLYSHDWKIGATLGSDCIQLALGVDLFRGGFLSFEGGRAWEWQADMRMDDVKFRSVLRYSPPRFQKIKPYVSTGLQYSFINTGYTKFHIPGVEAGAGICFPAGKRNELFLEGGWQYSRKYIHSRYQMDSYEILYEETWKAPPFFLLCGWRFTI